MKINFRISTIKASYSLWLQMKRLHADITYAVYLFDLIDGDESIPVLGDSIASKVEHVFGYLTNGDIVLAMFDHIPNEDKKEQDEVWRNYEMLLDNLSKLQLAKDYDIVSDISSFMNNINDTLTFFENRLKNYMLRELCGYVDTTPTLS